MLLLDLMMPNVDGLTVCRRLRAHHERTPILIATARTEVSDRVSGLDAGADDYLPKPFDLDELLARVRALLRRTTYETPDRELRVGDLQIDEAARRTWRGDHELDLTKTEFDLLQLLARNAGIVLDHSTIYERIWGYDFGSDSKSLAVYIGYLRRKTEEHGGSAADPDDPWSRLHPARAMTLRARLALSLAALAALSVVIVSVVSYLATDHRLHEVLDAELVGYAQRLAGDRQMAAVLCQTPERGQRLRRSRPVSLDPGCPRRSPRRRSRMRGPDGPGHGLDRGREAAGRADRLPGRRVVDHRPDERPPDHQLLARPARGAAAGLRGAEREAVADLGPSHRDGGRDLLPGAERVLAGRRRDPDRPQPRRHRPRAQLAS